MFRRTCVVFCLAVLCAGAQSVPTGFVHETLKTESNVPTALAALPDGRVLYTLKSGQVKVWTEIAVSTVGTVQNLRTSGEGGLIGIAVDDQWPTWPYLYLSVTTNDGFRKIHRYTCSGDLSDATSTNLSLGALFTIVGDLPDQDPNHNGGHLIFGNDGMLYAGLGDDTAAFSSACNALDPTVLAGKILRLDVGAVRNQLGTGPAAQGAITPPGNPFSGINAQLVWALGLRNPFSLSKDPLTGALFAGDVGLFTWEEVNDITAPGQNFGWPWMEGPMTFVQAGCPAPTNPISAVYEYPGSLQGINANAAIMIGPVYRNTGALYDFGPAYEGSLLIMDERRGFLRRLVMSGTSWIVAPMVAGQPASDNWGSGLNRPSGLIRAADGAIYYTSAFSPRGLFRVRPAGGATIVVSSGDNQVGNAGRALGLPLTVQVNGAQGLPLIGAPVTFSLTQGGGILNPTSALTDANGLASTVLSLSETTSGDPLVQAATPGAAPVIFNATWRGLVVTLSTGLGIIEVFHSQTSSPFTLAVDVPIAAAFISTPFGQIWTSILAPAPGLVVLDGLGLLGPPVAGVITGPTLPTWSVSLPLGPAGGIQLLLQVYGVDSALLPANEAIFVSQPVTVLIP